MVLGVARGDGDGELAYLLLSVCCAVYDLVVLTRQCQCHARAEILGSWCLKYSYLSEVDAAA